MAWTWPARDLQAWLEVRSGARKLPRPLGRRCSQEPCLGRELAARRWGARLAAGAYQTTGKCQCSRGHLSPPPSCRLLLPAQGLSASCGAWPGGQAESDPAFCGVPGLPLRRPAVTTGVKSLACSGPGGGFVGRWWKGEWMCVQPVACHGLLAQGWTVPTPPAPPPPCFTSFLALLVEVQPEQADSLRFGSSTRHPPLAS